LNQIGHRLAVVGWLLLAVALAAGERIPRPLCLELACCAALAAGVCALAAWVLVRPEDGQTREAAGLFLFSLLLAIGCVAAIWHDPDDSVRMQIRTQVLSWLSLRFESSVFATWASRAALVGLVFWIAITTALTRRGRE
jgi:hypothetical protein